MATNIVKLQAQLQHVPDDALINYVKTPDGQVPSYLALAEMSRRKQLRAEAQTPQVTPTQTVADQEIAQAEPGVAGLPVPEDMYSEESFNAAAGGIVAFGDGGDVKRFAGKYGSYIDAPGLSEADLAYAEALRNSEVANAAGTLLDYTAFLPYTLGKKGINYLMSRQPVWDKKQQKYVLRRDLPDTALTEADARFKAEGEAGRKIREDYLKANPTPVMLADQQAQAATSTFRPYADPRVIADKNKAQIEADISAGKYDPKPAPPTATTAVRRELPTGIDSLYKKPEDFSGQFEAMMRPEEEARAAMDRYSSLLGENTGIAAIKERINTMDARDAKEAEQAPWMALVRAGLGMAAGRSPYALQNVAEGATAGLKDYTDSKEKLARAEERRFDLASRVAQAERSEQVAAATYGLQSEERIKAHNESVKQNKLKYQADLASDNARNEFSAKKFKLEYGQKDREIDLMDKRIDKQIASTENQMAKYELVNKRDSLKTIMNEINDQIKTEQASLNPNPQTIQALQAKFNNAYNALYSLAIQGSGSNKQPSGNRPPLGSFNLK